MARRYGFRSLGLYLTGLWLILWGILNLPGVSIPGSGIVLVVIAIIAGIALLFYR